MIRLDIQEYCNECQDFTPDIIKPEKIEIDGYFKQGSLYDHQIMTDTIVKCKYAKRCEALKRYLEQHFKQKKNNY